MGAREVTIYTCDGCRATRTLERGEEPNGFTRLHIKDAEPWLCSVCYRAVEWVVRFQGILAPPTVYGTGTSATLRKPRDSES